MNIARISEHMSKSELYIFPIPMAYFSEFGSFKESRKPPQPPPPPPLRLCLCVVNDISGRRKKISKPGLNKVNTLLRVSVVVEVSRDSIDNKPFPDFVSSKKDQGDYI